MKYEEFLEQYNEIDQKDEATVEVLRRRGQYSHGDKFAYTYIPLNSARSLWNVFEGITNYFLDKNKFRKDDPIIPHLLDMGAGTGRIVKLAKAYGLKASGAEFYEPYVRLGREIHGLSEDELFVLNGFDATGSMLNKYNVIYTYMPISFPTEMSRLAAHLNYEAAYGTIFVEMLPSYWPLRMFKNPNVLKLNETRGIVSYASAMMEY